MNALRFSTLLALLIFTEMGRAGGLDTLIWRNSFPTGNETSTDLVNWLAIWTNTFGTNAISDTLNFSDPQSGDYSNRFYRAHSP